MTTRDDDGNTPEPGSGSASSFDAAQDLLRATLDEIRGSAGRPPTPPKAKRPPADARPTPVPPAAARPAVPRPAAAPPAPPVAPARAPQPSADDLWAPRSPEPQPSRATKRRRAAVAGGAAAATAANAGTEAATGPAPSPSTGTRRSRRPEPTAEAAAEAPTADPGGTTRRARSRRSEGRGETTDEFDGLTDELFQGPDTTGRRRRRRIAEDETAAAVPLTAAAAAAAADAAWAPAATEAAAPGADVAGPAVVEPPAAIETPPVIETPAAVATDAEVEDEVEDEAVTVAAVDDDSATPVDAGDAHDTEAVAPSIAAVAVAVPVDDGYPEVGSMPDGTGSRRRTGMIAAAVAVAAAVLIAFAVVLIPGGGNDDQALRTAPAARYTFATVTTPEGAEVTRVWELQGDDGEEFVGTLEFVNPTDAPLATSFTEVIPKAIAPDVADLTFQPQPTVVDPDPVVRYEVTIPAGGSFTARYEALVPAEGAQRSRLATWAEELTADPTVTTTTTTTTAPGAAPTTTTTEGRRPTASTTPGPTTPPPTNPPEPPPTNPPPPPSGTGVIVMRIYSKGGTGSFLLTGPGSSAVVETTGAPNGFGQVGYTVDVGTYPWTLQPADGWVFVGATCDERGGSGTVVSGSTVIFNVEADATVVCSFTVQKA